MGLFTGLITLLNVTTDRALIPTRNLLWIEAAQVVSVFHVCAGEVASKALHYLVLGA